MLWNIWKKSKNWVRICTMFEISRQIGRKNEHLPINSLGPVQHLVCKQRGIYLCLFSKQICFHSARLAVCKAPKNRYTLFANMTNRATKLFFSQIKYCWRKRDERVAVHCSLFAVNFSTADNFFLTKKFFVFVDETTTLTQILRMA